jgi:hypothetical protein
VSVIASCALAIALPACTATQQPRSAQHVILAPRSSSIAVPAPGQPLSPTSVPTIMQYPVPVDVANDAAKHKQVRVTGCTVTSAGATALGMVRNTGSATATYRITVFFTDATATTIDYATASVSVPAGASEPFTAQQAFVTPKDLLCVLVGVA